MNVLKTLFKKPDLATYKNLLAFLGVFHGLVHTNGSFQGIIMAL